jgi:hypothetical protein
MASKNYLKINNKTTHFSAFVDFFLSKRFQVLDEISSVLCLTCAFSKSLDFKIILTAMIE